MKLYVREKYLKKMRGFYHDTEVIKVITGVRRCGKSCLMKTVMDELRRKGISEEHLISFDLDSLQYRKAKTADRLEELILSQSHAEGVKYLFIDEIQNVAGFEEVVNAFREDGNYSIFITGSNSYLLSGELVTKLTGRYIEFEMFPLTFDEYLDMKAFYGKPVKVFRPVHELKGFAKVFLRAGEARSVRIDFDDKSFRYFNVLTGRWEEEAGEYRLCIGASSRDIRLTGSISRAGTGAPSPYSPTILPSYYSGKTANVGDREFATLLGHAIPQEEYAFTNKRKTRMVIHENCTVADLRYARGWAGRAFSGIISFAVSFCKTFGMRTKANTLIMGVVHQPVRGLAKYGGMTRRQMEGLLVMFNGKFFRGLNRFLTACSSLFSRPMTRLSRWCGWS